MKKKQSLTITFISVVLWIIFVYIIIDAEETGASQTVINTLYIILGIITLIILREPVLWYFRINDRAQNQEEIIRLLKKSVGENDAPEMTVKKEVDKE